MKHETMVYVMAIQLVMGARLARIGVRGGCSRRILLPMWLNTPPTLILSPMFNNVG
jgi:hypothetical protein